MSTRNMGTRNTELRNKGHGIQELGPRNSEHRNSEHGLTTYEVEAATGSGNKQIISLAVDVRSKQANSPKNPPSEG